MTETDDRADFENHFPIPPGVYWREESQSYWGGSDFSIDCANAYQSQFEAWQAAKASEAGSAQQAEAEPVARVKVHTTGGNVGLAWSAVPVPDAPLMRDGEMLYTTPPAPAPVVPEGAIDDLSECADVFAGLSREVCPSFCDYENMCRRLASTLSSPQPAGQIPEPHNIIKAERTSDQSVTVTLASCRAASAFELAVTPGEYES